MTNDASNGNGNGPRTTGIPGLPRKWQAPVRVISTFGLAVFLVLYYLFVIRPENNTRFEKMRQSIDTLQQVVQADQGMVSQEQAERLEDLYIAAVSPKVAKTLRRDISRQAKIDEIRGQLLKTVDLLRGIVLESGRSEVEHLRARIQPANPEDPDVPTIIVEQASEGYIDPDDPESVGDELRDLLRARAMAK